MEDSLEEVRICRICHENTGELMIPCRCKGTAQFVHRQCLDDWRRIKKKRYRSKAYNCEICLTPFRLHFVYPNFLGYVRNHWTIFEKFMYSSSLISFIFSVVVSFNAYKNDKVKRRSNVTILSKNVEKITTVDQNKKRSLGKMFFFGNGGHQISSGVFSLWLA